MKLARHSKIIDVINQNDVETQEELAERLQAAGFHVTQATVSRDIRELKLTKIAKSNGGSKYAVLENKSQNLSQKYARVLKDAFLSMDMAQNILVIHTVSGMAMAAAAALDELQWSEIVGCIAGDNTIFCAIRSVDETLLVMDKIRKMLHRV